MVHHRLSEKDFQARTAVCSVCGPVDLMIIGNAWMCPISYKASKARSRARSYHKHWPPKRDHCEACLFEAVTDCQLIQDVVGAKYGTWFTVWTLCMNCHYLHLDRPDIFEDLIGHVRPTVRV